MLKLTNVSLVFEAKPLLSMVNLSVSPGQLCWLKGANGSGKTSLLNAISGVIPQHLAADLSGEITFGGQDLRSIPLREKFHFLWQTQSDSDKQFFFPTCEAELAFALENKGIPASEIASRIGNCAQRFGLVNCLQQSPITLSGGQKKLLLCALGAALDPPIYLLDEPLAGLSASSVQIVIDWLKEQKELGKTLIVAEHNAIIKKLADLELPLSDPLTDDLLSAAEPLAMQFPGTSENTDLRPSPELLIAVNDLHFAFPNQNKLFKGFNLKLNKGECVLLQGENGSGKSTLLKLLLGFLQPDCGSIALAGQAVKSFTPGMFKHVYYQSQATSENLLGLSAPQNWQFWRIAKPSLPQKFYPRELYFSESSAGELQRYAQDILPFLLDKFWLLDEPFNHLDAAGRQNLLQLLQKKRSSGSGMLIVAHELQHEASLFDLVITL